MRCIAVLLLLSACAGVQAPKPTDAMAAKSGMSVADLGRGRDIYLARCGACHTLVAPDEHPSAEWPALVGEMKERAKLTDDEQRLVTSYLASASNR